MDIMTGEAAGSLRRALAEDIPTLEEHHRQMLAEIREHCGDGVDPGVMDGIAADYAAKLAREIPAGTCAAWIMEFGKQPVASGAVSIVSYVPVPMDPSSRIAFLHSIFTEKEHRHRHFACRIIRAAAGFCRDQGIRRLYLFASSEGRPLYEKAGFVPVPNAMLLLAGKNLPACDGDLPDMPVLCEGTTPLR